MYKMSDDDEYYPRHLLWGLGLLDSDEERDYNENANVDALATDNENEENYSQLMEDARNTPYPYLWYGLGLGDFPEESDASEYDDALTTDNESELRQEGNEFAQDDTDVNSDDVSIYDDDDIEVHVSEENESSESGDVVCTRDENEFEEDDDEHEGAEREAPPLGRFGVDLAGR